MPNRPKGMPVVAWEAYQIACDAAEIDITTRDDARVVQALGYAEKSKGFHAPDPGVGGSGAINHEKYTGAMDCSIKGLSDTRIATWIDEMARAGIAAFFRNPDDPVWRGNGHIHGMYCGVPLKDELDSQVRDFHNRLNGLVGHRPVDPDFYPTPELAAIPWKLFLESNTGEGKILPSPAKKKVTVPPVSFALYFKGDTKPRLWMPVIDGAALAPVRAWGTALGFDVVWNPTTDKTTFNGKSVYAAITKIAGVAHAPIRSLAWAAGLHVASVDVQKRKVVIAR